MLRAVVVVPLAVAALVAAGCGGSDAAAPVAPKRPAELTTVDQLREAFEADEGVARLVLLLSPT